MVGYALMVASASGGKLRSETSKKEKKDAIAAEEEKKAKSSPQICDILCTDGANALALLAKKPHIFISLGASLFSS